MIGRRAFLLSAPALALAGAAYPFVIESNWLEVCVRWIPLPKRNLGSLIRILHLSDLHASVLVPLSLIESAFRLGLESRPDLICLTGDFVTYGDRCDFGKYQKLLSRLTTAAPAFACLGNHDAGSWAVMRGGF